jgi:hypothetical protein
MPRLSALVGNLTAETAFTVLAIARALKARGKDVVELEIGDSPFPSTPHAKRAGILAIEENQTGYCPSLGLPEFRNAAARFVSAEFGYTATAENIVVGSGAKPFEQFFAEAVLDPPTPGGACRAGAAVGRTGVPPIRRGCPALPRDGSEAPGDLPELPAQPDRRRGHPRGSGRDR